MINLFNIFNDVRAIASIGAIVAGLVIAGAATTGGPVAVDTYADQQPDESFYQIERFGESIKSTISDEQQFNLNMANERINEFENMVKENKGEKYLHILDEAENRAKRAMMRAKDNAGLERAREVMRKHVRVLKRVENKVPSVAENAIEDTIRRSQGRIENGIGVPDNVPGNGNVPVG